VFNLYLLHYYAYHRAVNTTTTSEFCTTINIHRIVLLLMRLDRM